MSDNSELIEIESPRPHTTIIRMNRPERMNSMAIEMEGHTQLHVRLTTKNFEEATQARAEGRAPNFLD